MYCRMVRIIIALSTISRSAGVSHGRETACSSKNIMRNYIPYIVKRILPVPEGSPRLFLCREE